MSETREADVLVAGYGPVGATVAALLGNAGFRVVVADREREVYRLPRAIATDDDALRVWDTIPGLADQIRAQMLESLPVAYLSGDRTIVEVETRLRRTPSRFPPFALFHQPSLERQLRKAARRSGRVTEALGVEVCSFEQVEEGVEVTLRDLDSGLGRQARFGWLLGCDGASSTIRAGLGAGFGGSTFAQKWVVADTRVDEEPASARRVEFLCNPERPTVTMPMPGGRRRWEFMLMPGDLEGEMVDPKQLDDLVERAGRVAPADYERRVVYTFHARMADYWGTGRVFLLGDAAHVMPPFAGQGMTSGIRDAGNIWWKIAAVEEGQIGPDLMRSYELERRGNAGSMIGLAVRLGGIVQTPSRPKARLRDFILRLAWLIPGVKSWTRRMGWKPDTRIARGFMKSGRSRPGSREGRPFPSPEVLVDGHPASLDSVIGPNFAVVSTSPDPIGSLDHETALLARNLRARAVTIASRGAGDDVARVEDRTGEITRFLKGQTAIVRPDRFVFGIY